MSLLYRQPTLSSTSRASFKFSNGWPPPPACLRGTAREPAARNYSSRMMFYSPARPVNFLSPQLSGSPLWQPHRSFYYSANGTDPATSLLITRCIQGFCTLAFALKAWADYRAERIDDRTYKNMIQNNAVCSSDNFRKGRWWTFLTSSIMHSSIFHLGINMYALNSFGPAIFQMVGVSGFVGLWLIAALGCSGASVYWEEINRQSGRLSRRWDAAAKTEQRTFFGIRPNVETRALQERSSGAVGSSGALLGMLSLTAIVNPRGAVQIFPLPIPVPMWASAGAFVAFSYWALATGAAPGLGHAGHLGGMMGGVGFFLLRQLVSRGRGL